MMMRLDKAMVEQGLATTRTKAQDAIAQRLVFVNDVLITKNSFEIMEDDHIRIQAPSISFVSRAGFKLYDVLEPFSIDLQDRIVMDVGASTGGFSDVCLQQGAAYVYALDVGSDQMDKELLKNSRLCNMEHSNARYITKDMFAKEVNFACMDVSFISIKLILPALINCMAYKELLVLVKPQFEAGRVDVGKNGIIKNARVHIRVLEEMEAFVKTLGLSLHHVSASSILGRDGNKEFIFHLKEEPSRKSFDFKKIVENYHVKR